MSAKTFRLIANGAIIVGFILLARVIYGASDGTLAARYFPESRVSLPNTILALGLGLPVPLHVISVGLFLKRRWLSPLWIRIALIAVVISGCWLGIALAVKLFLQG